MSAERRTLRSAPPPVDPPRPARAAPVFGRTAEVSLLVDLLADPAHPGVVVGGEPGVGRSRLLDAVATRCREQGTPVHRLPVLRGGTAMPSDFVLAAEDRPLLVVDDAHLLDDVAASALHDLAVSGRVRVLLGVPTGARPPEPVVALGKDGVCRRVMLGPLPREACDDLVADVAGQPVDAATARHIWSLTGGLPRLVVDLVQALMASDLLTPDAGTLSWARPDRLPQALLDAVVADHLGGLDTPDTDALDLLACAGPVGPEILIDAGATAEALERLERRGVVAARRSGHRLVVEMPDPLLAMAARQRIGRLRRRHLGLRLAAAWEGRGRRRGDDLARSAGLLLDAGGTPPADVAEQGARQAVAGGDFRLAERLARSALASGAGASAARYLAEALSSQGREGEAESAAENAAAPAHHPALQLVRAANLRWGLADREASRRLVEDVLAAAAGRRVRAAATLNLAGFQLHDGRFAEALALAGQVLAAEPPGGRRNVPALMVSINALFSLGRDRDAVELAGLTLEEFGGDLAGRHPALTEVHRHQLAASVVRARLVHGDLDAAESLARALYTATSGRNLLGTATWASFLGELALLRGRLGTAVRLLDEATTAARRSGAGGLPGRTVRVLAGKNLARALIASGRPDAARLALADVEPGDLATVRAIDLWTGDVDGALAAAGSQVHRGVELVLRAAAEAREGQAWGIYVPLLHQAVRLGGTARLPAGLLDGVAVQGPLLGAQVEQIRAVVAGDAAALLAAAERYARVGAFLFAAEAAADAARRHDAAGQGAAARRAATQAQAYAARCEDTLPRVTALLREPTELTPRQREIARLAARGLPSRAIAERLVVSVRTVDNCLGQIYRKLGISTRAELVPAMGLLDVEPHCSPRSGGTHPGARDP